MESNLPLDQALDGLTFAFIRALFAFTGTSEEIKELVLIADLYKYDTICQQVHPLTDDVLARWNEGKPALVAEIERARIHMTILQEILKATLDAPPVTQDVVKKWYMLLFNKKELPPEGLLVLDGDVPLADRLRLLELVSTDTHLEEIGW